MQSIDWVAVLFRWLHIIPAIVLLGGTVFLRFVALPAAAPTGGAKPLLSALRAKWAMVSGICMLLLLVSGLWNFFMYRMEEVRDTGPLYHALFGVKVLLALGVFFIASALTGRSAMFEPLRAKPGRMLKLAAAMGLIVVLISGVLRNIERGPAALRPTDAGSIEGP